MLRIFDHMTGGKWPNILLAFVVPIAAYFLYWRLQFEPEPFAVSILGPERIGPWVVVTGTTAAPTFDPGDTITWRVKFCAGCYEQMRRVELAYGSDTDAPPDRVRVSGGPNTLSARLTAPADRPAGGLFLWVVVEAWDSREYEISWKLAP